MGVWEARARAGAAVVAGWQGAASAVEGSEEVALAVECWEGWEGPAPAEEVATAVAAQAAGVSELRVVAGEPGRRWRLCPARP